MIICYVKLSGTLRNISKLFKSKNLMNRFLLQLVKEFLFVFVNFSSSERGLSNFSSIFLVYHSNLSLRAGPGGPNADPWFLLDK